MQPRHEPPEPTNTNAVVRTVLGDMPACELGVCDAHEHVIIDSPFLNELYPQFRLDSVDAACVDVDEFGQAGGGWIIDTMPTGAGRDAMRLREVARRTGVPIVCPTGVHLAQYYEPDHPILRMDRGALTEMFIREVTIGVDDGEGIADVRAGVIKIAGGEGRLNAYQKEVFIAAAQAQVRTGCPIITHCEAGTAGLEQAALLEKNGADLGHVVLSHCDQVNDRAYHHELLSRGVRLEYDQHFRQTLRDDRSASIQLIASLISEFPGQIMVGMDIARRRNWHGYGGEPGLAWLVTELPDLLEQAGLSPSLLRNIFTRNAQSAFAMCSVPAGHR